MITVLLADDHGVIRDALRYLLEAQGDIQIVAMAADGQEAVEQAMIHCPDVAVMDISMPRMDGIAVLQHLRLAGERSAADRNPSRLRSSQAFQSTGSSLSARAKRTR